MATKKIENENVNVEAEVTEEAVVEKQAVNVLDLLLGADANKVVVPFKDMEITRLSKVFGAPFVLRCEAMSPNKYEELQNMAVTVVGKEVNTDVSAFQIMTVIEGVRSILPGNKSGGFLFKDKNLMNKFDVPSPKELVRKILLPGEIINLYQIISNISGFSNNAVVELKN